MEKITLQRPINTDDAVISELNLDFDALTAADFRQISKLESMISDNTSMSVKDMGTPKKLSFEFHLATAFLAAVKGTQGLSVFDFTKLSMEDSLALEEQGAFFCMGVI